MTPSTSTEPLVITREFDAPRALVWRAITEPDIMDKWFAPEGATTTMKRYEFKVGGIGHYRQVHPGGLTIWGKMVFQEISPIHRLAFVQRFSDEHEGRGAHPLLPVWPMIHSIIDLEETAGDRTRLSVTWRPHEATAEEVAVFDSMRDGVRQGWAGTFDNLDTLLRTLHIPQQP